MFPVSPPPDMAYLEEQARFEAMRRHAKKGHILQRHEDLRREYERLVRVYEREVKHVTSRIALTRTEYMDKMEALEAVNGTSGSFPKGVSNEGTPPNGQHLNRFDSSMPPTKAQKRRSKTLLFRVEKRGGIDVYIKTFKGER